MKKDYRNKQLNRSEPDMRNLLLGMLFSFFIFACTPEPAEDRWEKAKTKTATEKAEDTTDAVEEMAEGTSDGPQVEPLPDWDSLPPIEEEMAAEEGSTMMEKAEDKAEEIAEKAKDMAEEKAGEMIKSE